MFMGRRLRWGKVKLRLGTVKLRLGIVKLRLLGPVQGKMSQDASMEAVLGAISNEDVAGQAHVDLEHRGEAEMESTGFRISTEQLSSDSSF